MSESVDKFLESLLPYRDNWDVINIKVIARRTEIGWLCHIFHAVLDTQKESVQISEDLPDVDDLLVIHEHWEISKLEELIAFIIKGEVSIGNNVIHVKQFDGNEWKPLPNPTYNVYDIDYSVRKFGCHYVSLALVMYASESFSYLEKNLIEHRLRSGQIPWGGLEDLRRNFVNIGEDWVTRNDLFVNIVAPFRISLQETKIIDDDKILIVIKKTQLMTYDKISLSIIAYLVDGSIFRKKFQFKNDVFNLHFKSPIIKVKIMVTYGDYHIDGRELYGKPDNRRVQLYQHFLNNVQNLETELKENGRYLESKVSLLFNILGFSSAHFGFGTGDTPDIIAFANDDKNILVIECTKREPDLGNKITKLSTRAKEVKDLVGDVSVLPVIFTALDRSMINKTDEEKALKEQIVIISNDDIPALINFALENKSAMEVYSFLYHLLPYPPPL